MTDLRVKLIVGAIMVAVLGLVLFVIKPIAENCAGGGRVNGSPNACAREAGMSLGIVRHLSVVGQTNKVDCASLLKLTTEELCDGLPKSVADIRAVLDFVAAYLMKDGTPCLVVPNGEGAYHPESGTLDLYVETDKLKSSDAVRRFAQFVENLP